VDAKWKREDLVGTVSVLLVRNQLSNRIISLQNWLILILACNPFVFFSFRQCV